MINTMTFYVHQQQANNTDEKPKRKIDHTEELETLRSSIAENEELIHQLQSLAEKKLLKKQFYNV